MTKPGSGSVFGLPLRNALADWSDVESDIAFAGSDSPQPVVTIAITTYMRNELLVEAVRSALEQDFAKPFEVIILDNDPDSDGAAALAAQVPEIETSNFRYFANRKNIGVFGNFNRCITVARADWLTILNDDDLLDSNYLTLMFSEIDRHPRIDGMTPRKRYLDEGIQPDNKTVSPANDRPRRPRLSSSLYQKARASARKLKLLAREEYLFLGQKSRRIVARKFFWDAVLGNGGGFIFRRSSAIALGGFYVEEYPSADYWFYARFAQIFHLHQHRTEAVTIRITGENLMTVSVIGQLRQGVALQRTLAATVAPKWWVRWIPLMLACAREGFNTYWRADVSREEIEGTLGIALPSSDTRKLGKLRLLFRVE